MCYKLRVHATSYRLNASMRPHDVEIQSSDSCVNVSNDTTLGIRHTMLPGMKSRVYYAAFRVIRETYPSIFWSNANCLSAFACTRGDERVPLGDGLAAAGIVPAGMEAGSTAGAWAIRGLRRAPAPAGLGGSNESTSIKGRLPRMLLGSPIAALIEPRT